MTAAAVLPATGWAGQAVQRAWRAQQPGHYRAAALGQLPAEALTTRDRHLLIHTLANLGMPLADIAHHTRTTPHTTHRILTTPPN